jgi:hypothetical protein
MQYDPRLTNTHLQILRENWSTQKEQPELSHLIRLVDHLHEEVLQQLVGANIKFISHVASLRLENGRSIFKK